MSIFDRLRRSKPSSRWAAMIRLLRQMVRELVRLPLVAKMIIVSAIAIEFIVITQWETLTFKTHPASVVNRITDAPKPPAQRAYDFPNAPPEVKAQAKAVEAALSKRMVRIVLDNPQIQSDGSIIGNGQTVHLYGIKPFDRKTVCMRASGERWACGLQAYAALRNTLAHKTIVCDPKKIMPGGVSAICHMGPIDIAALLTREGLTELDGDADDSELVNAQAAAKSRKLGIWDR